MSHIYHSKKTPLNFSYLHDLFLELANNQKPSIDEFNMCGTRLSAKTLSITTMIAKLCCLTNCKISINCFRYWNRDLTELFEEIKTALKDFPFPMEIKHSNHEIRVNGHLIKLHSLYSHAYRGEKRLGTRNYLGYDYCFSWVEEAFEFEEEDFRALNFAIRGAKYNIKISSTNPWSLKQYQISYMNKFLPFDESKLAQYNSFEIRKAGSNDIKNEQFGVFNNKLFHYSSWRNNIYLTENQIQEMISIEQNNPNRARTISYGLPGIIEGGVFTEVMNRIKNLNYQWNYLVGSLDFGEIKDAMAVHISGINSDQKHLKILEEYYQDNQKMKHKDLNTQAREIVTFVWNSLKKHGCSKIFIYCDYSESSFITMLNNEVQRIGVSFAIQFVKCKKFRVHERIKHFLRFISIGAISIDKQNCHNLIFEMENLVWDEKSNPNEPKPVDKDNHCIDSIAYNLAGAWDLIKYW